MGQKNNNNFRYCERWSFVVPVLCYVIFFCIFVMGTLPLKSNFDLRLKNDKSVYNKKIVDTFEIKIKNSNFNSDKAEGENQLLNVKSEYLINTNNIDSAYKFDQAKLLEEVFRKADKNKNNKLDSIELAEWIRMKILEHISYAISNNIALFSIIDNNPKDGVISWKEYHTYFLRKRGFSKNYVKNHDEKRHKGLQRSIKEQIMKDKAVWMEAAKSNPNALTAEEFLAFTHPESSAANHLALVDELYDKFDRDGDEILTEDEFAVLQTPGGDDEMLVIRQDENERRTEFRKSIDLNGDGRADRRELLHYVAPSSPRHSEHEAEALLALTDNDHDNMLSLDEMLAHPDLFLKSKMVDTALSFHDEF